MHYSKPLFIFIVMPVVKTFSINDEENNRKYLIEEMPIEGGFVILDEFREECTYLDMDESKELLEWMKECLNNQNESI